MKARQGMAFLAQHAGPEIPVDRIAGGGEAEVDAGVDAEAAVGAVIESTAAQGFRHFSHE